MRLILRADCARNNHDLRGFASVDGHGGFDFGVVIRHNGVPMNIQHDLNSGVLL